MFPMDTKLKIERNDRMLNYVMIMGRLTADPELKITSNGIAVTSFSIAVQRSKPKGKEPQTDYFDCVAWNNRAKIVCDWYSKGSLIMLVGTLRNNKYTDKNGIDRTVNRILVREIHFTNNKKIKPESEGSNADSDLDNALIMQFESESEFIDFGIDDGVPF